MDRKKFLKKVGLGISLVAGTRILTSCKDKDEDQRSTEDCKLTGSDILGPYFVANSSNIVNLNTMNLPGTTMMMMGKVYSGEGTNTPVVGAKIEIWHADDAGAYHPEGSGDVSDYDPSEITLRGFVLTEADGSYAFQSIRPGLYGSRARHIHFKVTATDHPDLVTQTYFEGDSRISEDAFAKDAGDCRIVSYTDDGNGVVVGVMDFNLEA